MENRKTQTTATRKQDDINWQELIQISLRNWKWFVVSVILCVAIGVGYILIKVPVFYVSAQVLLKDKDNKMASPALSMLANLGSFGGLSSMVKSNLDNEVGIMNTRAITKEAIYDLGLHIICKTKDGLKTVDMYPNFPYLITVDPIQVDTISSPIRFKIIPKKNEQFVVKGKYKFEKFQTTITDFPAIIKTPSIDVKIDKNQLVSLEKEDQVVNVTIQNPNVTTYKLRKLMEIKATSKKTTIISLGLEAGNIPKAQDLINQIIAIYNIKAANEQNEEIDYTAKFVNERLSETMLELDNIEKDVESYKLRNNLTDPKVDAKIFLEKTSEYEVKRLETQIQLNILKYLNDYIRDERNKDKLIPSMGIEDKGLLAVIVKYNELLTEKNSIESTSSTVNPSLSILNQQLSVMRQNILANFQNVEESLLVVLRDLDKQTNSLINRIKSMPRQEREYVELARQQEIYQTMYLFLLQKKEEAIFNLATITPKVKIIDPAMPDIKPVAPRKLRLLGMVGFLGICIPFVIIYGLHYIRRNNIFPGWDEKNAG